VSIKLSPLDKELAEAVMLTASAESRLAASSKEVLVLVLGSTKKLTILLPLKVGTFLMARVETSRNEWAVSKIKFISSLERSLMPKRCFDFKNIFA
jgi:hypothetical protein